MSARRVRRAYEVGSAGRCVDMPTVPISPRSIYLLDDKARIGKNA
jgi:hypothetical protein